MSSKKMTLNSSDGESFEVAMESQKIKRMIEDDCIENGIPLPVTGKILSKVIEYCKEHVKNSPEDLKAFDTEFVKLDRPTLFDLVVAANFLDMKGLLGLSCQAVVDLVMKTPPEEFLKELKERLREPVGL